MGSEDQRTVPPLPYPQTHAHPHPNADRAIGEEPPRLRNDCFALPPNVSWTPVPEALSLLQERAHCVTGTEEIDVTQTAGRILAHDVLAKRLNPPQTNSAVDGYAFAHESLSGADPEELRLRDGRSAAGQPFAGKLDTPEALRILTGASLPAGADTVVLQEDVAIQDGILRLRPGLKKGANSRLAGEDAKPDQVIFKAGHQIRVPDVARMVSAGVGQVCVRKKLRVAVLSTGDELAVAGGPIADDAIYDANNPMLSALVQAWGCELVDLGRVADRREDVRAALDEGAKRADVILTSGGASAGDEDHVSALLRDAGTATQWRIAIKPGRPLALAVWDGAAVFGLPGNPVAAFVCALVFARPTLLAMAGGHWQLPRALMLPAAFRKRRKQGRSEYLRARLNADGQVEAFYSEGSGLISGLSWADGLVELPDGDEDVAIGDLVRYIPYSSLGI